METEGDSEQHLKSSSRFHVPRFREKRGGTPSDPAMKASRVTLNIPHNTMFSKEFHDKYLKHET